MWLGSTCGQAASSVVQQLNLRNGLDQLLLYFVLYRVGLDYCKLL